MDADEAGVVTYWFMLRERRVSDPYLRSFGYYRDLIVRYPDGRWRIKHRLSIAEASTSAQPNGKLGGFPTPEVTAPG